ncbi:MAG: PAS domain S-box protein [Solirubrobacteraceae bacterium]
MREESEPARVERELAEANDMLHAIFDHVPAGMALRGLDGRYLRVNASVARALGAAPHELVGREPAEDHDPAAGALIRAQDEEMLRTGRPLTQDQSVRHADGSEHDYLVLRYPVLDDHKRVSAFGALSLDVTDRTRAERELLDAERRFRMLLEAAPDPIVIVDVDGLIALVNTRTEELFGFAREELLGQPVEMLMPLAVRDGHVDRRRRYTASPYLRQLEVTGRRKDGSEFPAEMTLSGLATDSGVLIVSALRDITALKRGEREREQALAELHEAQYIAQLGSWRWDPGSGTRVWSAGMYELHGTDPAAGPLNTDQSLALVQPDDLERVQSAYAQMVQGGEGFELDYRLISAVRGVRMVHAIARPDPEQRGCYRGTLQDVTALRESEQALRESEQALRERTEALAAVIDSAPIGMAVTLPGGRFERVNQALCELLGYSGQELLSMNLSDVTHPDDLAASTAQQNLALACEPSGGQLQRRYVHRDGHTIWTRVSFAAVGQDGGAPRYLISQIQDITDRERTQEALTRSQERLEQAETVAQMGSWEWDLSTDRVSWSSGLYKLFELEPETADRDIEHGLRHRVHPEDREHMRQTLDRAVSLLESVSTEYRAIRADGHIRMHDWRADPIVDQTGKPVRVIGVVHDITDTKRTQQALSAASSNLAKYVQELQQLALGAPADGDHKPPQAALSARQIEVLRLVADGLTNEEIGKRLFISAGTVKWHIGQILTKTNSANRTEAVARVLGADRRDASSRDPT